MGDELTSIVTQKNSNREPSPSPHGAGEIFLCKEGAPERTIDMPLLGPYDRTEPCSSQHFTQLIDMISAIFRLERLFILRVLQPFSQYTQRALGLDCFDWSLLSMLASAICNIYGGVLIIQTLPRTMDNTLSFMLLFVLFSHTLRFLLGTRPDGLMERKRSAYKGIEGGCANQYLLHERPCLCWAVPAFVYHAGLIVHGGAMIQAAFRAYPIELYWLSIAFSCCTPLPPGKSLLRSKLSFAWKSITSTGRPEPETAPA